MLDLYDNAAAYLSRPSVSFVVPCKGRLDYLQPTIRDMLDQETDQSYEIVLVDYDCPQRCGDWLTSYNPDILYRIVKVTNRPEFNLSHARNIGVRYARSSIVYISDADMHIDKCLLQHFYVILQDENIIAIMNQGGQKRNDIVRGRGIIAVRRRIWKRLRGFDESMKGWGYEETDFYRRLIKLGKVCSFPRHLCRTRPHGDSLRTQYYRDKNRGRTNRRNRMIASKPHRLINPDGIGNTRFE